MSRRRGQTGSIGKNGNWWTVRFWMDVPGQEERVYMREKICPTSRPGLLSASARKLKAKEIIAASGADKAETLQKSIASDSSPTFRQQAEKWLKVVEKRDAAPSTLLNWRNCLDTWILPTRISGVPFGDYPLANIKKSVAQELIDAMVAGGLSPKSIRNYFQVVKFVFSSAINEDGDELHPRNWKGMQLTIPEIEKKKQRRPCFKKEVMNSLANSSAIKPQMRLLFILCAASGLRIGEVLGIRIENIHDNGSRIVINSKAWHGEEHDFLKTPNGDREIDLPANVAKLLIESIGDRKSGLLFQSKHGKPLRQSNILRRHLHPALESIGAPKSGFHAFRRFRTTFLRNHTHCPEGIINFWLGWGDSWGDKGMGDLYDEIKQDVQTRKDRANLCGVGFEVPTSLLGSIEPMNLKSDVVGSQSISASA
jgi:integrase